MEELAIKLSIFSRQDLCHHCEEIQSVEDWYNVTIPAFNQVGGSGLFNLYRSHSGSMHRLLSTIYPEYPNTLYRLTWLDTNGMLPNFVTEWKVVESHQDIGTICRINDRKWMNLLLHSVRWNILFTFFKETTDVVSLKKVNRIFHHIECSIYTDEMEFSSFIIVRHQGTRELVSRDPSFVL